MPVADEGLPILLALDASGALRHVDEVPNGLACGCTCPDPSCGQELVARNRGMKRAHHFAHRRGTCEWSVEYVITALAAQAASASGSVAFPALSYADAETGRSVEISPARTLRIASAAMERASGRGAPELVVTCKAQSGAERRFAFVFSLVHGLSGAQRERLAEAGLDAVLVDLRSHLRARRRQLGKHYDRAAAVAAYQDKAFIVRLLASEGAPLMSWEVNSKRDAAEAESRRKLDERRVSEALERERDERTAAERGRAAEAERARQRAERERLEKEEAERSAEEARADAEESARKTAAAAAAEAARFEARGFRALPLVARGVNRYADGCPLHGEANVAMFCGAYSFSTNHCEHFRGMGRFSVGCAAPPCPGCG